MNADTWTRLQAFRHALELTSCEASLTAGYDHLKDFPAGCSELASQTPDPAVTGAILAADAGEDGFTEAVAKLRAAGLRAETDLRNEKIGFKVREAQMMKIPYMFVLGDREAAEKTVTIRNRKGDNVGTFPFAEAVAMVKKLNEDRTLD